MNTTTMQSLIELPSDLVEAIKTSKPDLAQQIHYYHVEKYSDALKSIANLSPESDNFKRNYQYMKEVLSSHEQAIKIWSNN